MTSAGFNQPDPNEIVGPPCLAVFLSVQTNFAIAVQQKGPHYIIDRFIFKMENNSFRVDIFNSLH